MSYAQWSAAWWQWALALPVAGHPFDSSNDSCNRDDQSGSVWFLASSSPQGERSCTIPADTALFLGLANVECSSLETPLFPEPFGFGALTKATQRDCATFYADHIVNLLCKIDGESVPNLGSYRVVAPQFTFEAPTPWIFTNPATGEPPGGTGMAVSAGYFLMIKPLSIGLHKLECGGTLHFSEAEGGPLDLDFGNIYRLMVE
jgi:hypothetical protein